MQRHVQFASVALFLLMPGAAAWPQDVENGRKVYFDHGCYACHGYNGTGRRPLANRASGVMISKDIFIAYLRQRGDQNANLPSNGMPSYSVAALDNAAAADVYAYIETLVDDPPKVEDIPAFTTILESIQREEYEDAGED